VQTSSARDPMTDARDPMTDDRVQPHPARKMRPGAGPRLQCYWIRLGDAAERRAGALG
jgi:hypothetical protein